MMRISTVILFSVIALLFFSCQKDSFDENAWQSDVESWHQERIESLNQDDSWLSLAGLYWLQEGRNSFGSDPDQDIVFEYDEVPDSLGWFILGGNEVKVDLKDESGVKVNGELKQESVIYRESHDEGEVVLTLDQLSWYIIERSGNYAIRLKDHEHPHLIAFEGIERFPVSPEWRIEAEFIEFDSPMPLTVPDYTGIPREEQILGALEFAIDGKLYRLYPIADSLDERFFVIFADETNGQYTYSAGRFVYTDPPDENGKVIIDFNRSYNPPCVFSPYATCPLPPPENKLDVSIPAGELDYESPVISTRN